MTGNEAALIFFGVVLLLLVIKFAPAVIRKAAEWFDRDPDFWSLVLLFILLPPLFDSGGEALLEDPDALVEDELSELL